MPDIRATVNRHRPAAREAGRKALKLVTRLDWIPLEYPPSATNAPRYGHGRPPHARLAKQISAGDKRYAETLQSFARYRDDLAKIETQAADPSQPSWINDFLPGLDGGSIYGYLRDRAPARYLEIGSGNSTKFAARAIRDGALSTRLISIDPHPRLEIDGLCDDLRRSPIEQTDLAIFADLRAGDIVFFDGSHNAFMDNDVVTFFLDILPELPAGVLVGIHDIYLPDDYPPAIAGRFYNEQYMLAAYLLGGADVEIELPVMYVCSKPELRAEADAMWADQLGSLGLTHGATFWLSTR